MLILTDGFPLSQSFYRFNGKQTTSALSGRTKLLTRCTTGVVPLSLVFRIVGVCLPSHYGMTITVGSLAAI